MDNADNGSGGPKSGAGGDCRSVRLASWSVSVAPYHFSPMLMLPFDNAMPKARYRTYPILDLFNFSSDSTGNDAQSATGPSPPKLVIRLKYS